MFQRKRDDIKQLWLGTVLQGFSLILIFAIRQDSKICVVFFISVIV